MVNIQKLREIAGSDWVVTKREEMLGYLADETNSLIRPKPADNVVVVKPKNSKEISEILKLANIDKTSVFVRGGGTGVCGGAVLFADGILISTRPPEHYYLLDLIQIVLYLGLRSL